MKKLKFLFLIMLTTFISVSFVNAETLTFEYKNLGYMKYLDNEGWLYSNLDSFYKENPNYSQNRLDDLYNYAIDYYNNNSSEYPYYYMSVYPFSSGSDFTLSLWLHLSSEPLTYSTMFNCYKSIQFSFNGQEYDILDGWNQCKPYFFGFDSIFNSQSLHTYEGPYFNPLVYYSSNYELVFDLDDTYIVNNYQNKTLRFKNGDIISTYYDSFISSKYIEVNLDDYEYVILNLKDYSKKEPFETNFKVKGSIGITPVYEFGTVEKEVITDICNISYQDFTDYRFFILKNDLINNSIYLVKSCKDNSSFKYDSTVFNITYVTDENVDDPVITFGGVNYHTIPFKELSNTVNDNTENGFIPGESGSSSTDVLDNITNYVSSFWNSLSTFMSLVTKFFNTLPIEIRAISITMFTTACTLGLIKILKA